jgi:hypothetical protein
MWIEEANGPKGFLRPLGFLLERGMTTKEPQGQETIKEAQSKKSDRIHFRLAVAVFDL